MREQIALLAMFATSVAFIGQYFVNQSSEVQTKALEDFNARQAEIVAKDAAAREKITAQDIEKNKQIVVQIQQKATQAEEEYKRLISSGEPLKAAELLAKFMLAAPDPPLKANECVLYAYLDAQKWLTPHLTNEECMALALDAMIRDHKQVNALLDSLPR